MVAEHITEIITQVLKNLGLTVPDIHLEHPDLRFGDYATNVALIAGGKSGEAPRALAERLASLIHDEKGLVAKAEVAGPGFINITLSNDFLVKSVREVAAQDEKWGSNKMRKGEKVMIEYTDPNPFKEFHIGHLVPNAIGESLSRLIAVSGAKVARANYQGDVGLHVAKALWGVQKLGKADIAADLGFAYAEGARAYEENAQAKEEIEALNRKIYDQSDAALNELYDRGRKLSLEQFEVIYKRLGTKFDHYFFESAAGTRGTAIVLNGLENGVFEKSDDAIVFRGERYGLHTRVFLTSAGLPTYEAKDLGLAQLKKKVFPFDQSITITGSEQAEYFKVVKKALELIDEKLAGKIMVVTNGMLRLATGKMSSRRGDIIRGEDLLDELKATALLKMKERDLQNAEEVADAIGVAAIKYAILKQGTGKDIIFDREKSLSLEGDSGPYLQYAHTRACSIERKAKEAGVKVSAAKPKETLGDLERLLYRFPEVVLRAASEYEPHYLLSFLTGLAGAFNNFYATERVIEDTTYGSYKLALTKAFRITMRNGLELLGIKALERM